MAPTHRPAVCFSPSLCVRTSLHTACLDLSFYGSVVRPRACYWTLFRTPWSVPVAPRYRQHGRDRPRTHVQKHVKHKGWFAVSPHPSASVVGGVMTPERALIPRTCGSVALNGERDFVGVRNDPEVGISLGYRVGLE